MTNHPNRSKRWRPTTSFGRLMFEGAGHASFNQGVLCAQLAVYRDNDMLKAREAEHPNDIKLHVKYARGYNRALLREKRFYKRTLSWQS